MVQTRQKPAYIEQNIKQKQTQIFARIKKLA